jgi:CMP-N,N'-diacetyllegionaminic acid synthase
MIDGKRILVVVPARGGSKGLPNKNLRPLCGVPLVALVGRVIKEVAGIDRAVVSTDSTEIAQVARGAGLEVPFLRPADLSGDRIGDVDVLVHALGATEETDGCRYDVVVMLQPTSPLRTAEEVRGCLDLFFANDADAVWSVSLADRKFHPLKQLRIQKGGRLSYYDERGAIIIARQQLDDLYYRNGVAYVLSRSSLVEGRSLMGTRTYAYVTLRPHISIDTAEDLALAEEYAIKNRLFQSDSASESGRDQPCER